VSVLGGGGARGGGGGGGGRGGGGWRPAVPASQSIRRIHLRPSSQAAMRGRSPDDAASWTRYRATPSCTPSSRAHDRESLNQRQASVPLADPARLNLEQRPAGEPAGHPRARRRRAPFGRPATPTVRRWPPRRRPDQGHGLSRAARPRPRCGRHLRPGRQRLVADCPAVVARCRAAGAIVLAPRAVHVGVPALT